MRKIRIEKGCPSVDISLTIFHSCSVVKWVSPSYQRHLDIFFTTFFSFSLSFDSYWQSQSSVAGLFFVEIVAIILRSMWTLSGL